MNGEWEKKTLFIIWICVYVFIFPFLSCSLCVCIVSFPHHSFCVCHVYTLMLSNCVLCFLILNLFATIVNFTFRAAARIDFMNTPQQNNTNFKLTQVNQHLCVVWYAHLMLLFRKEKKRFECFYVWRGLIVWRST